MKKIFFYIFIFPLILSGCEKDLMDYEGLEGVYFAVQWGDSWGSEKTWPYQPYTDVQFMDLGTDTATVRIRVLATGPVKDYSRTFRVEINPDSSTVVENVDYLPLENEVVIGAGKCSADVPVRLIRTEALQTETKTLGLKLMTNSYFGLSFPEWDAVNKFTSGPVHDHFDASLHTLRISDMMVEPKIWTGTASSPYNDWAESGLWGGFTRKKIEMICERFDLTYADFSSTATMPQVLQNLIAKTMSQLLIDRYNAKDPVLEEDGRLMYFGYCPWKSKVGVPWIPDEDYYN